MANGVLYGCYDQCGPVLCRGVERWSSSSSSALSRFARREKEPNLPPEKTNNSSRTNFFVRSFPAFSACEPVYSVSLLIPSFEVDDLGVTQKTEVEECWIATPRYTSSPAGGFFHLFSHLQLRGIPRYSCFCRTGGWNTRR